MGIFGWSLPPGCGELPGEADGATNIEHDSLPKGIGAWWHEDGPIGINDTTIGTLDWDDDKSEAENVAAAAAIVLAYTSIKWETFCKRTNDPKLAYIESMLDERGIPHRRNGESWHAPILQVPAEHMDAAWKMLGEKLPGRGRRNCLDDMPDDHPAFR